MSEQQDNQEVAHLQEVNDELTRSLGRCRELVEDCRSKLAANANEPLVPDISDNDDDIADESDRA